MLTVGAASDTVTGTRADVADNPRESVATALIE